MILKNPVISFLLYVLFPSILVIAAFNFLFAGKKSSLKEDSQKSMDAGNYKRSEEEFVKLLEDNELNIENHRGYITAHFPQPFGIKGYNRFGDHSKIISYYDGLATSEFNEIGDLGNYGRGLIESRLEHYSKAVEYYSKVINQQLPYFNDSYGYVLFKMGLNEEAAQRYWQEIKLNINTTGAVNNLTKLLLSQQNYSGINSLLTNITLSSYVPDKAKRLCYLHYHDYYHYAKTIISEIYHDTTVYGLIAAFLILLIWFFYFIFIYIGVSVLFEHKRLKYLLCVLFLGCIFFAIGCTPLYDFYEYALHFKLNGSYINDLLYCIFGIGFIEETVKIIPVFLILIFTKQANKPIDILIYGCVSALGFAFMENYLIYFQDPGLRLITGRALTAVVMHMGATTVAAYGLIHSRHKLGRISFKWFLFTFSIACLSHGLYDYFLFGPGFISYVKFLYTLPWIFLTITLGKMLRNGLSISTFNNKAAVPKLNFQIKYLSYCLTYIILIQYVVMVLRFNLPNANISLHKSISSSWYLIFIIVIALTNFKVKKSSLSSLFKKKCSTNGDPQLDKILDGFTGV